MSNHYTKMIDTVKEHTEKYGPNLNYVEFPVSGDDRLCVLTVRGKAKLDADTLMGHLIIEDLQKKIAKLEGEN